jgi:pSer/pThr/pTyr-binding forkhead associated (FHA) protein
MDVRLVMFKDNGERKDFPLGEGITFIGRQDDCDLRIPLSEISRKHAQLIIHQGAVTIRDMGSANGTYINNRRVTEQDLTPGDHIIIGPVVFTVQIDGQPEDIRQVRTRVEPRPHEPRAKAPVADASAGTEITVLDEDDLFSEMGGEIDPISALEHLAASGEQNIVDGILDEDEGQAKKS